MQQNRSESTVKTTESGKAPTVSAGNPANMPSVSTNSTNSLNSTASINSTDSINKSPLPKEEPMSSQPITYKNGFYYEPLNDSIRERITGSSYPADNTNAQISYDELRYVSVLYYNFNDKVKTGELICHQDIAQDLVEIFYELYQNEYPIEKIRLIDEYSANDDLSMQDNNTSCFNYRVIANTTRLSNHSFGKAIDLNPFYNPYVSTNSDGSLHISPEESAYYADRDKDFSYKINTDDLAYKLFTEHGFTWGGNWNSAKDYQHFEKE